MALSPFSADGKLLCMDHKQFRRRFRDQFPSPGGRFRQIFAKTTHLAFNNAGTLLATGDANGEVQLFNLNTPVVTTGDLRHLTGHNGAITALAFNPDGTLLASSSTDKTLRIWDATTSAMITTLNTNSSTIDNLSLTADGKNLIAHDQNGNNTIYAVKTETVG